MPPPSPYPPPHTNRACPFELASDGNWVYPGLHGPLSSLRLEAYRMGLEDRALLALLTPAQRMQIADKMVSRV